MAGKEACARVFVVHGEEREWYERSQRELSMEQTRMELEVLRKQVEKGELKEPDKIGVAAVIKLRRNHGHRYFDWELGVVSAVPRTATATGRSRWHGCSGRTGSPKLPASSRFVT